MRSCAGGGSSTHRAVVVYCQSDVCGYNMWMAPTFARGMDTRDKVKAVLRDPIWDEGLRRVLHTTPAKVVRMREWLYTDLIARVMWIETLQDGHLPDSREPNNPLDARAYFTGWGISAGELPSVSISDDMAVVAALCLCPRQSADGPPQTTLLFPGSVDCRRDECLAIENARREYVTQCIVRSYIPSEAWGDSPFVEKWRWLHVAETMVDRAHHSKALGHRVSKSGQTYLLPFGMMPWTKMRGSEDERFDSQSVVQDVFIREMAAADEERRPPHWWRNLDAAARADAGARMCPLFSAWLRGDKPKPPKSSLVF